MADVCERICFILVRDEFGHLPHKKVMSVKGYAFLCMPYLNICQKLGDGFERICFIFVRAQLGHLPKDG